MSKQRVSKVNGREVKFFNTIKEAREYNRTEGTIGIYARFFVDACIKQTKNDVYKRWFVFLDTKPENTAIREINEQNGAIIPNVAGQPVKFFPTRHDARQYYWVNKGFPAKYLDLHKLHVPYEGNVNNYRWFVYI